MQLFSEKYTGAWQERVENAHKSDFFSANITNSDGPNSDGKIVVPYDVGQWPRPLKFTTFEVRGLSYDPNTGVISGLKTNTKYKVEININVTSHPVNYGFLWQLNNGSASPDTGGVAYDQCTILGYANNDNRNLLGSANVSCTVDTTGKTNPTDLKMKLLNLSDYTQTAYYGSSLLVKEIK